jgi:hypothetical protein
LSFGLRAHQNLNILHTQWANLVLLQPLVYAILMEAVTARQSAQQVIILEVA